MSEQKSPEERLRELIADLRSEYNGLQILGRALTPEELARSQALNGAVESLETALSALEASPSQ